MKKQIKLNNEVGVDLEKLIEGGMVILANSGGGKSYLIRRIAEQAVDNVQIIIIDPEGEFASLREKFDFILAGKNADVPAEPRSAALLATKLLELNKSAVIDLYELHPQERQRFVKLFCDALVNCPKALYHPVLIVLDEAHEYVPEGKPSEATWAVESLASKGRKRGQRLILASQRIAKISKNVTAEANNKLIGRASQDIDMKRAGDELGFSKDKLVQLRQLKPGEFFAFGPAISDEVIKLKVGEVKTEHAKIGYKGLGKTPPPSEVIKKVLSALKDLPAEAKKEAQTIQELKDEIRKLKSVKLSKNNVKAIHLGGFDQKFVENAVKSAISRRDLEWGKVVDKWKRYGEDLMWMIKHLHQSSHAARPPKPIEMPPKKVFQDTAHVTIRSKISQPIQTGRIEIPPTEIFEGNTIDIQILNKGERIILNAIAQYPEGMTTEHLAVLTGYKSTSRTVYTQSLAQKGYITKTPQGFVATPAGMEKLGDDFEPLPEGPELREHLLQTLPAGEKKVFEIILALAGYEEITKQLLMEQTGYKSTSISVYVQKLTARKVIESNRGVITINEKLL